MQGGRVLLALLALIASGLTTKCSKRKTSPAREIFCYTSTFDTQLLADSICSCTTLVHLNHDVQNLSISDIANLRKSLKEMYSPLQFVISIHDVAKTLRTSATLRQEAIARIIAVAKEVDGIELNVTSDSKERLYNFVKSLKHEITRKSYDKRILMALPTKSEDLAKQFDFKELTKHVDLFTLRTDYLTDEDGAFVTFHPSRLMGLFDLLNTDSLVDLVSELGVPKRKILISLPASAYKFILKNETENTPRSQTTEKEPTSIDRKQLCEAMTNGEWIVERDEDLTAPYAFQNETWISFEDKISVGIKGKYVLLRDLAGLAVQDVERDVKTECEKPLTQEIYHSFTELKRKSRQAILNALEDELHQSEFSYSNQAKTSNFRVIRAIDTEGHIRAVRENTQTEFVCRRQGYFVHPKSCNRFYRCVKFNQAIEDYSVFEFDCPAGLSFDERTEVCVWPGSLPQGSPCPGSSEIAPVAPKRFECPSQPGYYADSQNCRWFFACIDLGEQNLMAFEFRCPYGLVFDEKKLVCEWPWLVPACSESGSAYTRAEYDYGGYTGGTSSGVGTGGYVTGGLPDYSATAGTAYSGADYSRTTGIHQTNRINYFGSTAENIGGAIDTFNAGTVSKHVPLSGSVGTGGYEGSVSHISIPDIHIDSVSPDTIALGRGSTPLNKHVLSTDRTEIGYSGYNDGINTGYVNTESFDGISTRENVNRLGVTNYFGPTGLPELPTNIRTGSSEPKYIGSTNLYTDSSRLNTGGYSTPTDIYLGATRQRPSPDKSLYGTISSYSGGVETTDSINRGYSGSTTEGYRDSTAAEYSKTASGASAGSAGIDVRLQTSSKPEFATSGIFATSGHSGITIPGSSHFISDNTRFSGTTGTSSTGVKYNSEEGYTIPVFIHQEGAVYPSVGTTGVGYTGTAGTHGVRVTNIYEKPDSTGHNLNISIIDNKIPSSYGIQTGSTGTILTGNTVEGSVTTGDFLSGTVLNHGSIPGDVSTTAIHHGTVLIGGTQPGYIVTSSGIPGYVTSDEKNVDAGSIRPGTPVVSLTSPSRSSVVLKNSVTPKISGQTPEIPIRGPIYPGTIVETTRKPYVSPSTYHGISDEEAGNVNLGFTLPGAQYSTTVSPKYFSPQLSTFTPSGFTKTGPTKTGITTAVLGGGGSYSVSTSERRPILNPENIGEKAFEGNVGYTKASTSNIVGLSSTLPSYSPAFVPDGRVTPQSTTTSGYSYSKPSVKFETTSSSAPISPTESYLPVTTPTPFLNVQVHTGASDITNVFGSKISTDRTLLTPTGLPPIVYTTEYPNNYKTTLFEAAKIPVTTARPTFDTGYGAVPTSIPVSVLSDDRFTQQISGSQAASIPTPSINLMALFQQTDSSSQQDYNSFTSSSPVLEYLPGKSSKPDVTTAKYGIFATTVPSELGGITYKKPDVTHGGTSTVSLTTSKPSDVYYSGQRFSTSGTVSDSSPTNLGISREEIDKLITNYDRGTIKYTPSVHDTFLSSEFDSTKKFASSSTQSSSVRTDNIFDITIPFSLTTSSYEVTTKSPEGKGKVIVKWSDLHPLLLGKLGAECTCKADPFATLRGPIKKLIDSSKGKVDLANYDESDVYVDLENDDSSEESDYITNYDNYSPQPYKISQPKTTDVSDKLPSSSYLPLPSTTISTRNSAPTLNVRTDVSTESHILGRSSRLQLNLRSGKKLNDIGSSSNSITADQREDPDQIIDGANDCARPGLFRHPNFCNKFYACHWDQWKKKFTLHIFNCPVHLTFDTKADACNWPSKGPACQAGNLLV